MYSRLPYSRLPYPIRTIIVTHQHRSFASDAAAAGAGLSFELREEQLALQDAARKFAQKELPTLVREVERTNEPVPADWRKRYASAGFLGVNVSSAYGGLGLGNLEALLVLEEFAKMSSAVAFPVFESCVGPIKIIENFGSEELKRTILPRVCRGELVMGIAMSEPNAGSALTDLSTRATLNKEGTHVTLRGQKRWMSGGGHADMAVFARFGDAAGAKGIGAVYVPRDTPGVSFGARETLLGFRGIPSADIFLDNVTVPAANVIIGPGGFPSLMAAFDLERCGNATMALAQAQAALDDVIVYVQDRQQFGKPIVDFQAVQLKIAEMRMKVDAARLLLQRAVVRSGSGLPSVLDSSLGKCFCNEMAVEVTSTAMYLMGAYGYSTSFPMERRVRDALGWRVAGGTIDIQKINIAASIVGRRFNQRAV